ncbi:MAG TPA: putative baseplate assembly protein [Pyrinomonadaceae bacterium]|nr:putative baseplate assembly protein [Pyrinomonadaceae bacterium]
MTPATLGNRPGLNAIEYRAGTHGTFLETMKARLAGSEFSSIGGLRTRHTSDPSIALLDAWATVGDVLTFHQERIANEGYLRTATERRSVLELARLVGYELRPGVAANAYLAYTLDKPIAIPALIEKPELTVPPPDPLVTIPEGSRAQSIPGPGELPQAFETSDDLVARFAWNNLQVRLNRPQQSDFDKRLIYLKGTPNLKPGDPLMIIASPPVLYRVETVTPDPPANRTKVTFRSWLEIDLPREPSDALLDNIVAIAERFSEVAHFGVLPTSRSTKQVLAQLTRLRRLEASGITAEEMKKAVEEEVLPKLKELHQAAVSGRFTRIEPWLQLIVEELQIALQGGSGRSTGGGNGNGNGQPRQRTADLVAVLDALSKPRSIPPKDSQELGRTVGGTLGSTTDIAPQVLTALRPELKPVLYKAWENVPVTLPSPVESYSFKVRASVFGHNAPLEPIRNSTGAVIDSKEWELQAPGAAATETFEILINPESEGVFSANIFIGNKSTGFAELENDGNTRIDFREADDRVDVTLNRTANDGRARFVFRFHNRPIQVQIEIRRDGTLLSAANIRTEAPVVVTGRTQSSNRQISVKGEVRTRGTAVATEDSHIVWLDAPYPQILPGSWVALEKPSSLIDPVTGQPRESTLVLTRVLDVSERSRAAYGLSQKSTRLRLENPWIDPTPGQDNFETIRGTAVIAGSEILELAEEPIETPISGNEIELEGLYDGLESGRWLIISGERADVVARSGNPGEEAAAAADEISVPGVPATELVMLAAVEQRYDLNLEGDKTHTFLRLANSLNYSYKRNTVIVYGNVVNATHGETRREVLGSGNAGKSLQEFTLKQSPLTFVAAPNPDGVETTLQVRVNDVLWHEADGLAGLGPNDYRYVTRTDDEAKTSVIFGTGEHGARLPTGADNVTAVYRNGIGKAGNVRPDQISLLATRPLGVKGVTNPMAASGGADRESRDQAKRSAPLAVTALDRLVSTQDYGDFARTFTGIGKASAARLSDGQRRLVHLTIAGAEDIPIETTSDLYRNLNKALRDYGDPHQPILIELRTFLMLVIEARVRVLPDYLFEKVEPKIRAALLDRFSFERRELGQDALLSDAIATIQNVKGVSYVDVDKFDWIDEEKVLEHLSGGRSLGEIIVRKDRIPISLARVDTSEQSNRIKAAELAYFNPTIPDTIILSEIS